MDVLTDVLRTLRLRSTIYFQADFCAPWGMDIKGGSVANFHLVVDGECWLRFPDQNSARLLSKGDIVVLAHGDRHALVHSPEAEAPPAETMLANSSLSSQQIGALPIYGGNGAATTLICGHYEYDRNGMHPLLGALPPLMHLKREQQTQWISAASELTIEESKSHQDGSAAVLNRLAEILLIQVIRVYARKTNDEHGFLTALTEPLLAEVLNLLHEAPARAWQLSNLASACGVSRSILSDRFKQVLGIAPIQYLTLWRMHKARAILTAGKMSVAQAAEVVGYANEWSFSKAYKRVFGEGPGAARRTQSVNRT